MWWGLLVLLRREPSLGCSQPGLQGGPRCQGRWDGRRGRRGRWCRRSRTARVTLWRRRTTTRCSRRAVRSWPAAAASMGCEMSSPTISAPSAPASLVTVSCACGCCPSAAAADGAASARCACRRRRRRSAIVPVARIRQLQPGHNQALVAVVHQM